MVHIAATGAPGSEKVQLTKGLTESIILAVAKDAECQKLIPSVLGEFPPSWGIAGGIRNFTNDPIGNLDLEIAAKYYNIPIKYIPDFLKQRSGLDPEDEAKVCTGLARATAIAINKAKMSFYVSSAFSQNRVLNGTDHTATGIKLMSGITVVFDWHATLRIRCPLIYPSIEDFNNGTKAITADAYIGAFPESVEISPCDPFKC